MSWTDAVVIAAAALLLAAGVVLFHAYRTALISDDDSAPR